jgi:hypothetical protein
MRIFSPSLRNGPFTGLEWSFLLRDEGFSCSGEKLKESIADIEKEIPPHLLIKTEATV